MVKDVWILEDSEMHRKELEGLVSLYGFNPISFVARNPFLRAYIGEENRDNVHGMILDNIFPIFDEVGCEPEKDMGIGVIRELNRRGLLENLNVAIYTSDEMSQKIEEVCEMGVTYYSKNNGPGWVKDFLGV